MMHCDETVKQPAAQVVLVHGTFAPDAAWTQRDSRIRQIVVEALSALGSVRFCNFVWPGTTIRQLNNSHSLRLIAGRELGDSLVSLAEDFPAVPIFLISH